MRNYGSAVEYPTWCYSVWIRVSAYKVIERISAEGGIAMIAFQTRKIKHWITVVHAR